jgi:PTS system mannose-specific IIB component/fructoselysine and glucoselysine-specific PTS system IIB component
MPILLCRVDDRLIHGQVVVGWGAQLGLDLIAVIDDELSGFILARDIATMRRLAEHGALADIEVNLGGLHSAPGRQRVLPYLFFSDEDRAELRRLKRAGVNVSAQDVPSARRIGLDELLEMKAG